MLMNMYNEEGTTMEQKQNYVTPEIEIIEFETEDIIITSDITDGQDPYTG